MTTDTVSAASRDAEPVTKNQIRGFFGAFGGWTLDGFDQSIFGLVLAPAMIELLPKSGYAADVGTIGYFGQLNVAIFLLGWGCSFVWGPIADRTGRIPALTYAIIVYAVFTCLSGFTQSIWQLAFCRFIAAIGIGGEWAMAATLVAEIMPERLRSRFGGILHAGVYFGVLSGALINYLVGIDLGWRWMFYLGLLPALFVFYIRWNTTEPERWVRASARTKKMGYWDFISVLFQPQYRQRTIINVFLIFIALTGYWAGSQYLGATIISLGIQKGLPRAASLNTATLALAILSFFTIIGCLLAPIVADRIGRRLTLAISFVLMIVGIAGAYGWGYYQSNIYYFLAFIPILGIGGADFALFTIWLPEQYPTEVRASAFAFCTTMSRFMAAAGTFVIGWAISAAQTAGWPLALTAIPFVIGLLLIPMATETKNQVLPA
jgi:MFS family permease